MELFQDEFELRLSNLLLPVTVHDSNISNVTCAHRFHSQHNRDLFHLRFTLVAIGSVLAIIGVLQNSLLYYLFTTRQKFRESACFFLAYVALFDAALDVGYLMCMAVQIGAANWQIYELHVVWWHYIKFIFTITKLCKLTSTLCLIAASTERYRAASLWTFQGFNGHTRLLMLIGCILVGIILRGPQFIYIMVSYHPECTGFARYRARILLISNISKLLHIIDTVLGIGLPFTMLIYLNVAIVYRLHQQRIRELRNLMLQLAVHKEHIAEHDGRIRHATRTLACLVVAYLLSNALDVVLAMWELIDRDSITAWQNFHQLTGDLIWMFTVIGNVVRLPIYATCDPEIFRAIKQLCCQSAVSISRMVSTTSLDNIEQALHQEEAITQLRRLSRALNDFHISDPRRHCIQERIQRTMSALHLNQPETISGTYANSLHPSHRGWGTSGGSEQGTLGRASPRRPCLDLDTLFLPDIDLLGSQISLGTGLPPPQPLRHTQSAREPITDLWTRNPLLSPTRSPVIPDRMAHSLSLPQWRQMVNHDTREHAAGRPIPMRMQSVDDRAINQNNVQRLPVSTITMSSNNSTETARTTLSPTSYSRGRRASSQCSSNTIYYDVIMDEPSTSSQCDFNEHNEQVNMLRNSSQYHPQSLHYNKPSLPNKMSSGSHASNHRNHSLTPNGGTQVGAKHALNMLKSSPKKIAKLWNKRKTSGNHANGHVPLLVITKAEFDTDDQQSDDEKIYNNESKL